MSSLFSIDKTDASMSHFQKLTFCQFLIFWFRQSRMSSFSCIRRCIPLLDGQKLSLSWMGCKGFRGLFRPQRGAGMNQTAKNDNWLAGNPAPGAQAAALWIGSCGLLILGLQPILLGALLSENRVNFDQLALAATAEIIAIGAGSVLTAFLIGNSSVRLKAGIFLVLTAVFDHLTAGAASPQSIVLWRGLAGLAEGGLVAFAVELIARSRHAGRYGGYFVSMQTIAQSIIAALLALVIIVRSGSAGGFETLAIISLASLVIVYFLPVRYGALPTPDDSAASGLLRPQPLLALFGIFLFYMFLGALWAFLEPLGADAGIDSSTVGLMVSASLGAQVAGALLATLVEARLPFRPVLILASLLAVVIAVAISQKPDVIAFWGLAMMTGFIWLFVVPFQIRLAVEADAARGAALLVPAAQLVGAALGPAGASFFIESGSSAPIAWFAAASALASAVVILLTLFFAPGAPAQLDKRI
jgi:MFS transporter, DHA1 family, inner membrane transport protein